jgi:hypothetical protein
LALRAFLDDPNGEQYGFGLMRSTRVKSGSPYPILEKAVELVLEKEYANWALASCSLAVSVDMRIGLRCNSSSFLRPTGARRSYLTHAGQLLQCRRYPP